MSAKREADMIVRDAELRGEKVTEELRAEETRLKLEMQSLRRMRRQLLEEFRAVLARYDRLLNTEVIVDANDVEQAS